MSIKTSSLPPYSGYKDSGVEWLGDVPAHWEVRRLRNIVDMRVSNVDKHTKEGELPVRLCNYVDVYKNECITDSVPFMRATATSSEVARFNLELEDVLITKDSETWDDIGVPALVKYTASDLVCGYHVAVLRPLSSSLIGGFLLRVLQSPQIASQFSVSASGVTRYGLTHEAIKSVLLTSPPLDEQTAIVRYLDRAGERIQRAISAKEHLIELLTEQRQAVIHQAVTRGLDPNVRLKDSGVEWLGEVPEHWNVRRFSRQISIAEGQVDPTVEPYASMPLIAPNHLEAKTGRLLYQETASEQGAISGKYFCRTGDVIYSKIRPALAKVVVAPTDCLCSADMYPLSPRHSLQTKYLFWLLLSEALTAWSVLESERVAMPKVNRATLNGYYIPIPSLPEQSVIVRYLDNATVVIDAAINNAQRQIDLLREYRTRLIADVVTGHVDVRGAVEDEVELPVS